MRVAWLTQLLQIVLVLALAPLLTGVTRKVRARLLRRRGPPLAQPYLDLLKLIRKEVVVAGNASWLFRTAPYATAARRCGARQLPYASGCVSQGGASVARTHGCKPVTR